MLYNVNTIIGKREDAVINLLARQLIEKLVALGNKSLILSVCLNPNCEYTILLPKIFFWLDSLKC